MHKTIYGWELIFSGKAEASVVKSDDIKAFVSFNKQSQYISATKDVKLSDNKLSFTFSPHSFTQIKVSLKRQ